MKRRVIIFLIAGTTFLAGFSGVTAFLATGPDSIEAEPAVRSQQIGIETAPIIIAGDPHTADPDSGARGGGNKTSTGNSWSG